MPAGATGEWRVTGTGGNADDPYSAATTFRGVQSGLASYTWHIESADGKCKFDEIYSYSNNVVSVSLGEDKILCGESDVDLKVTLTPKIMNNANGSGINGVKWTHGSTTTTATSLGSKTFALYNGANSIQVDVTVGTCVAHAHVTYTKLTAKASANPNYVCSSDGENSVVTLNANDISTYPEGTTAKWIVNGSAIVNNINENNTTALISGTGGVSFTWEVTSPSGSCKASATTDQIEKLELTPKANEVCSQNGTAVLEADGSSLSGI